MNPAAPAVRGRRSYPGPPPWATPGLLRKLWGDRLRLLSDAAGEYGDVVRFAMGPKTLYFFNHPDHARHVLADNADNYHKGMGLAEARRRILGDGLLTSEGEAWRGQRRAISPAFRRERIAGFAGVVAAAGDHLTARLHARTGDVVDLSEEMTALTMDVLGRTLLDADLSPLSFLGPAFEAAQDQAMFEMVTLGVLPLWLPLPRHRRFRAARRRIEGAVRTIVSTRAPGSGTDGSDLMSVLLRVAGSERDADIRWRGLRDQIVTMLLAGHETTASTLSWAWYLLSSHPEAAERVRAEAIDVLGDRTPGFADLIRLPYTTTVIQETMRLYPAVWGLPRRAVAADEIGGYPIPAGADVMISPYTLHRHPGFWDAPDQFRPERFAADAPPVAHRYAYIPFGAGPRVCVGSHLGMLEAVLVAAMVARRFRFELPGPAAPQPEAMLSLRVRGGLPLRVLAV
ncbi:cytochrome P450 [Micromonospora profundi]|uniref:cytochrome P450 n=1 Tax=Micromonospora profundi TaxID=1420889 RepID=UPI00143C7197|nr:cytochrome P450 [Micromonospora profundi]NJC11460.1 cytochrome P450 [Micromonospora profundi]